MPVDGEDEAGRVPVRVAAEELIARVGLKRMVGGLFVQKMGP